MASAAVYRGNARSCKEVVLGSRVEVLCRKAVGRFECPQSASSIIEVLLYYLYEACSKYCVNWVELHLLGPIPVMRRSIGEISLGALCRRYIGTSRSRVTCL